MEECILEHSAGLRPVQVKNKFDNTFHHLYTTKGFSHFPILFVQL